MLFTMKKRSILISIAILCTLCVQECRCCFSMNETAQPNPRMVESGSTLYLSCICEVTDADHHNLNWLDNHNETIPLYGPGLKMYSQWESSHTLSLLIPNLTKSMSGTYTCTTTNRDGQTFAITHVLEVFDPVYFVHTNETQFIISGHDSLVICTARGHTQPLISWYKGQDGGLITNNEKYKLLPGGLLIKNVSKDDAGFYLCTAGVIQTGENRDRQINVEVTIAPIVTDIIAIPRESVIEGNPLMLECKADGHPLPNYKWTKENQNTTGISTWYQDFNKLVINNVTMADQGVYECIAYNKAGEANKSTFIEVLVPPKIRDFGNLTDVEGNSITVACDAIGRPQPFINITYYGPESDSPPEYNITSDDPTNIHLSLKFDKLQRHHEGWYDCDATNKVGSDQKSMYLTVLFKPYFDKAQELIYAWEDKTVNLSCEHNSNPKAIVTWSYLGDVNAVPDLTEVIQFWKSQIGKTTEVFVPFTPINNMLYEDYECIAKNYIGESKKIITVKRGYAPEPVENVNITDVTATSATFEISYPVSEPVLIAFRAEYDEEVNYSITNIHLNRTWAVNVQFKLNKLKSKTKYIIRFAGENDVGIGPYGKFYTFTTLAKSAPEPPVLDYSAETIAISADNKVLKLKPSENNGDPIDYYVVKYCPMNKSSKCFKRRDPPTTELKLPSLDTNTTYEVEIVAHNAMGASAPSKFNFIIEETEEYEEESPIPSGGIIGISIIVVVLAILLLDLLLFLTRKQGMIASCCYRKNRKHSQEISQSKDKKGLLKDNGEVGDTLKSQDNGHKEFEYNKSTGVITGKHSAV